MPSTATVVRRVFITAAICRPIVITALSNPSYDCIARATPRASHHHLRLQPPPPPQSPPTYLCSCQSVYNLVVLLLVDWQFRENEKEQIEEDR
ncbi:hypothetical protein V1477_005113 [Vespula maculifrons]|uniref:Secreted protein n=1 Tax=Vespula maculifrons TaxID=7453 RepID=A0ABD2CNQ6_VESMC